ncbi:hypothetical protein PUND_b0157 [Pseudoalteromonas undina]|nr:hypothetical protein PUND_b0157 [Pseudoalteromonas undina]
MRHYYKKPHLLNQKQIPKKGKVNTYNKLQKHPLTLYGYNLNLISSYF